MKEDVKLERRCFWVGVATAAIVFCFLFGFSFAINLCEQWKAIIDVVVALASGIFGSAMTLWINKKFDYASKKNDLLVDYFFCAFRLRNVIANVQPLLNESNYKKIVESYKEFDNNRHLWNELNVLRRKLVFKNEDSDKELVEKIYKTFKELMSTLIWNEKKISLNKDSFIFSQVDLDSNVKLFDIKHVKGKEIVDNEAEHDLIREYWPKTESTIVPILKELEKKLFNEETITKRMFPNASIFVGKHKEKK